MTIQMCAYKVKIIKSIDHVFTHSNAVNNNKVTTRESISQAFGIFCSNILWPDKEYTSMTLKVEAFYGGSRSQLRKEHK